jgi:hypothetical protein
MKTTARLGQLRLVSNTSQADKTTIEKGFCVISNTVVYPIACAKIEVLCLARCPL